MEHGIFRIDQYGYARFADPLFYPEPEAQQLIASRYPDCVALSPELFRYLEG